MLNSFGDRNERGLQCTGEGGNHPAKLNDPGLSYVNGGIITKKQQR